MTMHTGSSPVFLLVSVALMVATSAPATAQMQIPNPLIRPRSLNNPAPNEVPPLPGATAQRATPPTAYPVTSPNPGLPGSVSMEDPATRELNELKERFSGFYVSAIVGKQAVLRRSQAQRNGTTQGGYPAQAVGTSMAPVPMAAATQGVQVRNEALMLMDGESFDAIGNVGNLVARISDRQVVIYHSRDNGSTARQDGRRTIVFVGELETSGNPAQPAIVLERPDASYKRSIAVETRTRSASASSTDSQNPSTTNPLPVPPQ